MNFWWNIIESFLNNDLILFLCSLALDIRQITNESIKSRLYTMHLKKIFEFKNDIAIITFPIFKEEELNLSKHILIVYNSINLLSAFIDITKRLHIKLETLIDNNISLTSIGSKDEIHLGGPLTNLFVRTYLANRFEDFKFYAKKEDLENIKINYLYDTDCIKFTNDNEDRYFMIKKSVYNIDSSTDYLILVKFMKYDSKNKPRNTIHLIFNFHHIEKVNIMSAFTDNTQILCSYKIQKKYFLAIPINKNTGQIDVDRTLDFTDIFFPSTKCKNLLQKANYKKN